MKIVFMGTPEFAVASLAILIENGYTISGVVTAPDKPAGRGQKLQESAVKQYALQHGLRIMQPEKLKSEDFIAELKAIDADLFIVVAFRMLPEVVWSMPKLGTFNLHGSLLPQYRGAAPINWAVINGEKESGVTTFFLKHEIDTGKVIFQERTPIAEDETAGELHDQLMQTGAHLVLKTVKAIEGKTAETVEQDHLIQENSGQLKHAPKIYKEDCRIDWNKPVVAIHNLIRGLSPYPTAYTQMEELTLKIFRSSKEVTTHHDTPGKVISDGKTFLKFAAADGYINVLELQMEGKKRMKVDEFLRGYRLSS